MQSIACNLGRLGSRLNLIFEPAHQRIRYSPLGLFLDRPTELLLGVAGPDGQHHVFPFTGKGTPLQYVETHLTPTTVTWIGYCVPLFVQVEVTFTAPFWPQDERPSLWPGYLVQFRVRPMQRIRWHKPTPSPATVRCLFAVTPSGKTAVGLVPTKEDTILADWPVGVETDRVAEADDWFGGDGWREDDGLLCADVPVGGESPVLLWVAHTDSVVLEVAKEPAKFRYLKYWPTLADAVRYGQRNAGKLIKKSRQFDDLIAGSALSGPAQTLFAQSFQAYLMNTWWCDTVTGKEWFSVWEGTCLFHSTVDVEYNVALFYLVFWPRLLGLSLHEWTGHLKANTRGPGRYLDHDMGGGILANGSQYGHIMGVEEAANFLLLLLAHVRFNGDAGILQEPGIRQSAIDLVEYLLWTDQRGRGFPSEDVWNTIDDSAPAIQFGRQQTYLAVKRLAALRAAQTLGFGDKRCAAAVKLTKQTLAKDAWLGDHYAVCLDRRAQDVIDPNTGKPPGTGKLKGWDDYHIYSANGLLLLLLTGTLTDDDLLPRMRQDIATALPAALGPYGCSHNSVDPMNVWISQNIWRDCVAHYLGQPIPDLSDRYWSLQVWSNTRDQAKCFVDTYVGNNLSRYPRGITCAGYLLSLAGLVVDRTRGTVQLNPVIRDGRLPLLSLADWKKGAVPWLVVRNGRTTVTGKDILRRQGLRVV
jgi:hypothetical protein